MRSVRTDSDVEDAALTLAAHVVVAAADARAESRGCHTRTDHPHTDPIARTRSFGLIDGKIGACEGSDVIADIQALVP